MRLFKKEKYEDKKVYSFLGVKITRKRKKKNKTSFLQTDVLYNNDFEKQFLKPYIEFFDSPQFADTYKKFTKNVDSQSLNTIAKIINRMKTAYSSSEEHIDFFEEEEKKAISFVRNFYKNRIIQFSDNLFCYEKYFLPYNYFEPGIFLNHYHIKHFEHPENFANKAIFDVGAMIGDSSLLLTDYTTDNVYAFEPVKKNFELLKETIRINNCSNIIPVQKALSDQNGFCDICLGTEQVSGGATLRDKDNAIKERIELQTLDSYVQENNIKIGLIKVDIEGAEQMFLKGALETIKKQKPSMILSIYHQIDDLFNIKIMLDELNLGYKFKIKRHDDGLIYSETMLLCEI